MSQLTALLDANVLFSAQSRDILLQLARDTFFEVRWSLAIQNELRAALRSNVPNLSDAQLDYLLSTMNSSFPNALVTGFAELVDRLNLPDSDDRHVLAAAIVGRCDLVITQNIRHFPDEYVQSFGVLVSTPDDFLVALLLSSPAKFCSSVSSVLSRLKNPMYTYEEYTSRLEQIGLIQTSTILRRLHHLVK